MTKIQNSISLFVLLRRYLIQNVIGSLLTLNLICGLLLHFRVLLGLFASGLVGQVYCSSYFRTQVCETVIA